jgi:hypothetical protein
MDEFKGYTPKSALISDLVDYDPKGKVADSLDLIAKALDGKEKFIKIRGGEGFGAGFQGTPSKLRSSADLYRNAPHKLSKKLKKNLESLARNPKAHIAQDFIKGDKEYRVHVMLQNGAVSTTEGHLKVLNGKKVIGKSRNIQKDMPEIDSYIQNAFKNYAKNTKGDTRNQILGVDVLVDSKTGKKNIVEINDNSGSFGAFIPNFKNGKRTSSPPLQSKAFKESPKMQYRQLTGRLDSPTAARYAVGIGAVGTVGTAAHLKINKNK